MAQKRIAIISDLHCGHINGIATPKNQHSEDSAGCWKILRRFCRMFEPFDAVIVAGDTIEGKGGRNASVELTKPDMMDQADEAIAVLDSIKVKPKATWTFAGGTPYHTGVGEDFERIVSGSFKGTLADVAWLHVGGVRFRVRHKLNRAKNNLSTQIDTHVRRVGSGREPKADVLCFGHLHQYRMETQSLLGSEIRAIMCPALQGHTGYGARCCDGDVDIGAICIVLENNAVAAVYAHTIPLGYDTWGSAHKKGLT